MTQKHIAHAIDVFETKSHGHATGLFMFDNAPSHQKRAPDALSARYMPKNPSATWSPKKDGVKMRHGQLADGTPQDLYYPDDHCTMPGWFKGTQQILTERGLFRDGLSAKCAGFKCTPGCSDCCCCRTLFCQSISCRSNLCYRNMSKAVVIFAFFIQNITAS